MNLLSRFPKKPPMTPWQDAMEELRRKKKRLGRKYRLWKFYLYAFVILPVFAIMLALKALKTYVRIKLREIAVNTPMDTPGDKDTIE